MRLIGAVIAVSVLGEGASWLLAKRQAVDETYPTLLWCFLLHQDSSTVNGFWSSVTDAFSHHDGVVLN